MSSQAGVKHVATEPSRVDSKRERRRGASGRAAALRRAPSDSDCSGETASLSADSGDRSVRPAPPPPRSGKTRSRRRGSEWEVLEGLKDGQRFDKRPEVFNGYLHKKRKWPLKGWHKRFFVVDGGILVYARSPTDVARGRLHGSVDVGLSVISAKARRRRIDIDADEFIYHLRGKTPDVFRTWLNVLKAHRLYRQHLLTFGARESVPKIHAPNDDPPPTDTSSRTSHSKSSISSKELKHTWNFPHPIVYPLCAITPDRMPLTLKYLDFTNLETRHDTSITTEMKKKIIDSKIIDKLCEEQKNTKAVICVKTKPDDNINSQSPDTSIITTDAEKQMHSTDLEFNKTSGFESSLLCEFSINTPNFKGNIADKYPNLNNPSAESNGCINQTNALLSPNKVAGTPTLFLFSRKKRENVENNPLARKSKKSTNLVKYKNLYQEPKLKKPLSTCMLLDKYKLKEVKKSKVGKYTEYEVIQKHVNIQATIDDKEDKALQDSFTHSESDALVEKLLLSTFGSNRCNELGRDEFKVYLNEVVKELYDVKKEKIKLQNTPIQKLFKCLLQYWISNNKNENIKEIIRQSKSIDRQSNKYFAKDQTTSNLPIKNVTKATQFYGISDFIEGTLKQMKQENDKTISSTLTDSFIKERRIQELEKILKNTVYICGAVSKSREKDIKITKKLINNLDNISQQNINKVAKDGDVLDNSDSSNEIPKIQDTINNLISELPIPADVAKEFLGAYLDLLYENENNIESNSSTEGSDACQPKCDVQAEAVQKNISKSISTREIGDNKRRLADPGQIFLRDILDKVTTLFSKKNETYNTKTITTNALIGWDGISFHPIKDELGNYETKPNNDNSVLVNVSEYNLEHMSMTNDLDFLSEGSITMNLKDETNKSGEKKTLNLSLNFTEGVPNVKINHENLLSDISKTNLFFTNKSPCTILHTPFINISNEATDLKPYLTSSEESRPQIHINDFAINPFLTDSNVSSKAYIEKNRCDNMRTYKMHLDKDSTEPKIINEYDLQPCFILSLNKAFASKMKLKRLFKDNEDKNVSIKNIQRLSSIINNKEELSIFENVPKVIDEEFILLLLENISILSKDLPTLHKDINNLYTKLLRKHEKLCTNRLQGLSLLGKIYKGSSNIRTMVDKETQYEGIDCQATIDERNHASNTNDVYMKINNNDKALSAEITKVLSNKCIQLKGSQEIEMTDKFNLTEKNILMTCNGNATQTSFSSLSSEEDILKADTATSNQNWYRQYCMRDCAISTLIKCFLDSNDGCQNFRFKDNTPEGTTRHRDLPNKKSKNERKQSSKIRQDLIREINLLSPSFKVSIQSQTEKKLRWLRERSKPNDNNVYQLFLSKKYDVKRSCSMIEAVTDKSDDLKTIYRCTSYPSYCSGLVSPTSPPIRGPQAGFVSGTPGGRLAGWIIESGGPLDTASRELGQAQLSVQQLQRLLEALELQQQAHHDTDVSIEGASPNVKKDRRKFGLRKKKSNSKCASVELAPPHIDPSNSHMALSALTAPPSPGGGASSIPASAASLPIACAATRPQSLPGAEALNAPTSLSSLTPDQQLREDFTVLAKDLVTSLKSVVSTLVRERGRLRAHAADGAPLLPALRSDLAAALQQNSELRSRLSRIHDASDLAELSSVGHDSDVTANRQFQHSLSYSSSCVSASEFFDAEEHDDINKNDILNADEAGVIELDGDSSSEAGSLSSEEGSASSDNSDAAMVSAERAEPTVGAHWTRRTRLPRPRPSPGGPSLWNLLYKNIGKDLSQISMPVTINEPLNMLQRLCEELEYSELLEAAAGAAGAAERCALVAAFAVSAYAAAAHRAASKPFNPLLCETYECVREDRGFRFVAEQVSHHPPISACHAESPRWVFWQEARIKTKFWGKSMEFQPAGRVHVKLLTTGDHYSWNKVTTCVHNLFGGQRWVDQYGDMHITCHGSDISCKLNFIKASSWSSSRHEVRGAVTEASTGTRLRLAGRWSEALYAGDPPAAKCLWRPGAMPAEHELYYGFTRFAIELNELEPGLRELLPHTDTRFRPDQRALEEGDVEAAEQFKHQLEQAQRERRRDSPEHTPSWFRKGSECGEEAWVFGGDYWRARDAGFPALAAPRLW